LAAKNCKIDEMIKYFHFENESEKEELANSNKEICKDEEARKKAKSMENLKTELVNQTENQAIVAVTWRSDTRSERTEETHLVKIDGKWLLINDEE